MKNSRGLENGQQVFSKVFVFVLFCLYLGFVVFLFKNEYLNIGNSKALQQSIESTRLITEGMGVVFCKDF